MKRPQFELWLIFALVAWIAAAAAYLREPYDFNYAPTQPICADRHRSAVGVFVFAAGKRVVDRGDLLFRE